MTLWGSSDTSPQAMNSKKTCYIRTFGCQMNDHDSQKMQLLLKQEGYSFVDTAEEASLILFNTCSIREKPYHKAMSELGRAGGLKKKNRNRIIGICGCVAQQDGLSLMERFPDIDLIFGPDQIASLPKLLKDIESSRRAVALDLVNNYEDYNFLNDTPESVGSGAAFVTVMKGCNCGCTYCIVPFVRGREVCRSPDEIIAEIKKLTQAGVKEVTLLGQNVTAYEFAGFSLASLIRKISSGTDILHIRFTSPHPKFIDERLISEYMNNIKLSPHIHLPLQAGSNNILKKMGRGYTREDYLVLVNSLRRARPDISITSDFIVGFCGESAEDFGKTLDMLNEIQFDSIFAFKYSPRPGTPAGEHFKDDVPEDIKEKRLEELLSLQKKMTHKKNEGLVGSEADILVTGFDRKGTGRLMGRMPDNRIVNFNGNDSLVGSIVRVKLIGANANSMMGEVWKPKIR